jgi:phosphoserine phosphatase RsbU/P
MVDAVSGTGPGNVPQTVVDEQDRLESLAATDLMDTPAEEGFDRITRLAQQLFGVSTATVALVAQDRQFLKSVAGNLDRNIARADAFCSHTIMSPDTMVVEDAREDDRFSANPLVLGGPHIRFYAGQPLQGPGGWNIGTLCLIDQKPRSFSPEQQQIFRDLAAIVQREINVRTDMMNGAKIQKAHLPATAPSLPGYQLKAVHYPACDLSGDFYDWHMHRTKLRFTVADVMGKGTGPAILAATVQAKLRAAAHQEPGQALTIVSHDLDTNLTLPDVFVTAFHAELDPETGKVAYADAGHGLAHHLTAQGHITRLPTGGPPLGVIPGQTWGTKTITLAPGDALVVPTDGVLELFNEDLHQLARELPALAANEDIGRALKRLEATAPSAGDDVSVLVLRRNP